ncbi:MAG: zinc ribbon domain-containing protein, partial [Planctomycetota bacterium]
MPIAIVVGSLVGYLQKRETEVRLGFRRCGRHAAGTRYLGLRVDTDVLVVAVGDRSVKVEFFDRERPGAGVAVTPRPVRREELAPIPLADEVQATVSRPPPEDPAPTPLADGAEISEVEPEGVPADSGESTALSPADSKSAPPAGVTSTGQTTLGSNPCPWCGEERPPGANACNACGHGLRVEKRVSKRKEPASDELGISCPGCGKSLGPADRICVNCGF